MEADANLGRRIRALRHRLGISQQHLAALAAVRTGTIRVWEEGSHAPSSWRLPRLAKALGVPLEALFSDPDCAVLATFIVGPESLRRLRGPGREQALSELHSLLSSQIRLELERAEPVVDAKQADVRRRRTREQILSAQATRLEGLKAAEKRARLAQRTTIT